MDLIDRQAAIDAINNTGLPEDEKDTAQRVLEQIPPIEPEIIHCRYCKHKVIENDIWTCPFGLPGGPGFFCGYGAERRN